jgi:hypothetical protein
MKDGSHVIVRLLSFIAHPHRLSIASEVATIGFVEFHDIPVPAVFDYYITKQNRIGTEYIIMEKARGEKLGDRLLSLPADDHAKLLVEITRLEAALFSIGLPASGSIFYKRDLDPSFPKVSIPLAFTSEVFCIGPSVEHIRWYDRTDHMPIRRGACTCR